MNDYFKKIGSYTGKRVLDIFFHKVRSLLLSKLIFIILQYLTTRRPENMADGCKKCKTRIKKETIDN